MTQKQALAVKNLAKDTVEAIKVIMGSTFKDCPKCKDGGNEDYFGCSICNGTGKVGWEWEPEPGEWCIYNPDPKNVTQDFIGLVCLIYGVNKNKYLSGT